jgi:hypothetical protein
MSFTIKLKILLVLLLSLQNPIIHNKLSRFSLVQKQVVGALAINNPLSAVGFLPNTKSAQIEGLAKHLRSELRTLEAIFLHKTALSLTPHLSGWPATYSLQRILSVIRR